MPTPLTIQVPDDALERLQALAERECRTPEGQALWFILGVLGRRANDKRTYEERVRDAQPLLAELRKLHVQAGKPSTRELGRAVGVSHATVHAALRGPTAPTWPVLEKIVKALGGDAGRFRDLWADTQ